MFKDYGVNAYQIASKSGDAAKQILMVKDNIINDVYAICAIQNEPMSIVLVLIKVKNVGIDINYYEV